MAIKIRVDHYPGVDTSYPCLKIYNRDSKTNPNFWRIVLFNSHNEGQCVACSKDNLVGERSDSWAEQDFQLFHGRVVMENK